ncbi:hypothetical protein [Rhodobacter viridis]|uniref:hypothetical protein n=1 Tax=Rhodobacter viridis TaxID=1054202 RepID=UPI000DA1C25E|nr:hypothetical protein [Rhodobacter viridis]
MTSDSLQFQVDGGSTADLQVISLDVDRYRERLDAKALGDWLHALRQMTTAPIFVALADAGGFWAAVSKNEAEDVERLRASFPMRRGVHGADPVLALAGLEWGPDHLSGPS